MMMTPKCEKSAPIFTFQKTGSQGRGGKDMRGTRASEDGARLGWLCAKAVLTV